ncbi:MAG: hypothetical protein AAB884_02855 [Patescibacteria group bacterium]
MDRQQEENVDVMLAVFAAMAKLGLDNLDVEKLENSFPAVLEILGNKVVFYRDPVTGRYSQLYSAVVRIQRFGFCRWESPHYRKLQLLFSPRDVHKILSKKEDYEVIKRAAQAWHDSYFGITPAAS